MLEMLKIDLGIVTDAYDSRLNEYLDFAQNQIVQEGASINTEALEDMQLVVMYAAWMWRRRDTGEGMPRMVRYALNNKIFSGKMQ